MQDVGRLPDGSLYLVMSYLRGALLRTADANDVTIPHSTLWHAPLSNATSGQHENDFLDGIETSLPALAARIGNEETKVAFLRPALASIARHVDEATRLFSI